jgi:hypothetical protein
MSEIYILGQDDKLLTVLTKETGLVSTWFKDHLNSVPDEPFVFTVEADVEQAKYVLEENKVVFRDKEGDLRLQVIKELDDIDNMDGPLTKATCEPEFMENKERIIIERRIENRTQQFALNVALERTRWVGEVEVDLGLDSTHFYYLSAVDAVWKIRDVWGGDIKDVVEFDDQNNITRRVIKIVQRLGVDRGKRSEIDYDIEEIQRTVISYPVTALIGRGASLETDNGGFTRYINFADVEWKKSNGDPVDKPRGQHWVGDPEALQKYGREDDDGQLMHREAIWADHNIEDPAELLRATWEQLQLPEVQEPEVNYRMTLQLLESFPGYEHEKASLGDTIRGIDRKFSRPIEIQSRIIVMEYDVTDIEGTAVVEMGQFLSAYNDDRLDRVIGEIRDSRGKWEKVDRGSFPDRIPPVPANVRAEDGYNDIQLYWDFPDVIHIKQFEVYGSQVQGFVPDTQHLLGRTITAAFHHRATVDQKWYFRIRAVNHHGRVSDYSPEVSGSTLRIITDDILFGENVAEMLRRDMLIAEMIADDSITWDMVSEAAKDRIEQETRQYTNEEITLVENSLMNQIADKAGFDYVDGQLQLKADQATVDDQISTVMQELADKASLTYVDGQLVDKVNVGTVYTISEIDNKFDNVVSVTEYETDQQGIVQWMNATETRIEQTETDISSRVTRTEFDNLQIGGRNILKDTALTHEGRGNWASLPEVKIDDIYPYVEQNYGWSTRQIVPLLKAGTYTISVLAKEGTNINSRVRFSMTDNNYQFPPGQLTEDWKKFSYTFTLTEDINDFSIYFLNGHTGTGWVKFTQFKLERGNKATDWTPAPEDVDGEINAVYQRITTAETDINQNATDINLRATKTELNAVDSSLSEAWAEINIQAGLIEQRVSLEEYQTDQQGIVTRFNSVESEISQHAEAISQRVTATYVEGAIADIEVGGRNYHRETSNEFKNISWSSWNGYPEGLSYVFPVSPGETYTARVYYKDVQTSDGAEVGLRIFWETESGRVESRNGQVSVKDGESGYALITVTSPDNATHGRVVFRKYASGGTTSLQYKELKFEKGNKPTDWSPAPEDVDSRISQAETAIDQNATAINLRATKTEVNAIEGRLSQAESTLSVQADEIAAKVDVDGIVSELNINREGIRIRGALIELDGDTLIRNGIIGTAAIANGAIERAKLGTAAVGTLQVADGAITNAKISSLNADKINAANLAAITANLGSVTGGKITQQSSGRRLEMFDGKIDSYWNNQLSMSFGQYSLDFYNTSANHIGSFGPATHYADSSYRGLALTIEDDFFTIGMRAQGLIRPVFRASTRDMKTVVSGPFNGAVPGSSLELYANRRLVSTDTDYESDMNAVDQPSIILRQGSDSNDMTLYFGGMNRRNNAIFEVRWRNREDGSTLRIEASSNGVYLGGRVTGDSVSTGNIIGSQGNAYYENETGGNSLNDTSALKAAGIRTRTGFTHFYVGTLDNGELRVTSGRGNAPGESVIYRDIRVREVIETSSREYKTNIEKMTESALEEINKLTIVNFQLIDDLNRGVYDLKTGLIAEDSPFFATDDNKGIRNNKLLSYTVKSVQELSRKSNDHADEINWLKIENQLLRAKVAELEKKIA